MTTQPYLDWAREVFEIEQNSVAEVAASLNDSFNQAVDLILQCQGRVVITGMGKSGHIGRKIAASMASTGTPAFFIHPGEAAHGDLGMIIDGDVVIALSNSGESGEIRAILSAMKRKKIKLICITGNPESEIAQKSDLHLLARVSREACPLGLAPTSSTTAVLVLGDALTIALLRARSFTSEDFALSHPAGDLGKRLLSKLTTVDSIMHQGDSLPLVSEDSSLKDGIIIMSAKGLGILVVTDQEGRLSGVFTDGDLRRLFQKNDHINGLVMGDIMHHNPHTISARKLATEAAKIMEQTKMNSLIVVDDAQHPIGVLNMQNLLQARIV